MDIIDYHTDGGKNLIKDYLNKLPIPERTYGYAIRSKIKKEGITAFDGLNTRKLVGKLWEIKFFGNRIMYIIYDKNVVYFLHACKKQKGKAEKYDLDKAVKRAKSKNLL